MEQPNAEYDIFKNLCDYAKTSDDDVIRLKEKIKTALLSCPELLCALNATNLENGLPIPGENWDRYFGYAVMPYTFTEQAPSDAKNFICYTVNLRETARQDPVKFNAQILFMILCSREPEEAIDSTSGLARHDLIGGILREKIDWTAVFGSRCRLISSRERVTNTAYLARQMIFGLNRTDALANKPYKNRPLAAGGQTGM